LPGTSLDTPSEIAAMAAMDEQERQQFIERAVAGERVTRQLITTGIDGSGAIGVLALEHRLDG
jgi:hypothetical protein